VYDYLVVGAGLAGSTVAERLAGQLGARVLIVDRRPHLAGNAHDPLDAEGLRRHQYGPHIFHTNSAAVVDYLSAFTAWRPYEHRVLARVRGQLVPIPINRRTLAALYGEMDEAGAAALLAARAESYLRITTSEEMIRSRVGGELYELFFRGYTRKQWGLDPSELDATVCGRIPTRTNDDDRYFADRFQAMPVDGFTTMVERMLAHPRIDVVTGVDYRTIVDRERFRHLVFTGPIDEFFEYRHGRLPYRSLQFTFETVDAQRDGLPVGVINEPDETVPYTRTTDYRYLTGQRAARTVLGREFASATGDPYYPIPRPDNRELYRKYALLAGGQRNVTFVGRLAEYKYFNMDQVVASSLRTFEELARDHAVAS
jgi:UDP-galactopyranose mutase